MSNNKKKQTFTQEEIANAMRPLTREQMNQLTRVELLIVLEGEQKIRKFYEDIAHKSTENYKVFEDKIVELEGKLVRIKNFLYNPRSEKSKNYTEKKPRNKGRIPLSRSRNLEEKYPEAEVVDKVLTLENLPSCDDCQCEMKEMGIYEQSQQLVTIEKKYLIRNVLRMKYCCPKCQSRIQTTPAIAKIIPRGIYSDEFLMDLALSKFCDWLPVERFCAMAARGGFKGLPPNSLHEALIKFAQFLESVFESIRIETLDSYILKGDETTHRMLEGHEKNRWYLWGLFGELGCFFEYHPTRSGEVAIDVLTESGCQYFVSDAYSGYGKAIAETNALRDLAELPHIVEVNCNTHARRKFDECGNNEDAKTFIAEYREIYKTEKSVQKLLDEKNIDSATDKRLECAVVFERMKSKAERDIERYSSHNHYYLACQYFLNNFKGLTACLKNPKIPLDNNESERGLRPSVVGRKTWYGTHSEEGAHSAAVHFTIVESCKMNGVNPRKYYRYIVDEIHKQKIPLTPAGFKKLSSQGVGFQ